MPPIRAPYCCQRYFPKGRNWPYRCDARQFSLVHQFTFLTSISQAWDAPLTTLWHALSSTIKWHRLMTNVAPIPSPPHSVKCWAASTNVSTPLICAGLWLALPWGMWWRARPTCSAQETCVLLLSLRTLLLPRKPAQTSLVEDEISHRAKTSRASWGQS